MGDYTEHLQYESVAKEPSNCVCWDPRLSKLRGEADYKGWRFQRCTTCGTFVLNPRLCQSALDSFYTTTYDYAGNSTAFDVLVGQLDRNPWVQLKFNILLRKLRSMAPGGKLLDFGCGYGRFLYFARKYFDCFGYELNAQAAPLVIDKLNVPVASAIPDLNDMGPYDVITMHHVLEHTCDPLQELEFLKMLLAEEGLLVLTLPNAQSIMRWVLKENWGWNAFPVHNFHFSLKSLAFLIEAAGFELISINTQLGDLPTPMPLFRKVFRYLRGKAGESSASDAIGDEHKSFAENNGFLKRLYYMTATPIFYYLDPFRFSGRSMPLGSEICLIARKRSES